MYLLAFSWPKYKLCNSCEWVHAIQWTTKRCISSEVWRLVLQTLGSHYLLNIHMRLFGDVYLTSCSPICDVILFYQLQSHLWCYLVSPVIVLSHLWCYLHVLSAPRNCLVDPLTHDVTLAIYSGVGYVVSQTASYILHSLLGLILV